MKLRERIHPSFCFYAVIFGVILGIFGAVVLDFAGVGNFLQDNTGLLAICVAGCGMLILVSLFITQRWILIIACLAGVILGQCRVAPERTGRQAWRELKGQTMTITGVVASEPTIKDTGQGVKLKNIKFSTDRGKPVEKSEKPVEMLGIIYVQIADKTLDIWRSDRFTLTGELGDGFGTYAANLYRPKIVEWKRDESGDILAQIKRNFAESVRQNLPAPESELGLGYLVGDKTGMDEKLQEQLRTVGMTHVIVASGTHLGILVGAARRFLGKISKFTELFGATLLVLIFVGIVGFTPSMTRAGLVTILSLFVGYVGRSFTPMRLISFVAMITLLITPSNLLDIGWQLSFASFTGILVVAPRINSFLYGGKKLPWLAGMLITSLATIVVCAPVMIYHFGMISLLSFVANLVILPTLPYVMLLVLMTGIFNIFSLSMVSQIFASMTKILLDLHIGLVEFLSQQEIFVMEFESGNPIVFGWYGFLSVIIFAGFLRNKVWKDNGKRKAIFAQRARARPDE